MRSLDPHTAPQPHAFTCPWCASKIDGREEPYWQEPARPLPCLGRYIGQPAWPTGWRVARLNGWPPCCPTRALYLVRIVMHDRGLEPDADPRLPDAVNRSPHGWVQFACREDHETARPWQLARFETPHGSALVHHLGPFRDLFVLRDADERPLKTIAAAWPQLWSAYDSMRSSQPAPTTLANAV